MDGQWLVVVEELHPTPAARACSYRRTGYPVGQADQARTGIGPTIVRGTAAEDPPLTSQFDYATPKPAKHFQIRVKTKPGESKSERPSGTKPRKNIERRGISGTDPPPSDLPPLSCPAAHKGATSGRAIR